MGASIGDGVASCALVVSGGVSVPLTGTLAPVDILLMLARFLIGKVNIATRRGRGIFRRPASMSMSERVW